MVDAARSTTGRAREVGLPRRNNSTGRSGEQSYFRAEQFTLATGRPSPTCTGFRWEVPPGRPSRSGARPGISDKPGSAASRPTSPRPPGGCAPQMFRRPPRFLLSTPPDSTCRSRATWHYSEANGWRRTGAQSPAAEGPHRGMGGARTTGLSRRQDPLATSAERGTHRCCSFLLRPLFRGRGGMLW